MTGTSQFFINHGLSFLFLAIFVEQLGIPIPAFPWLLAAGALCAAGKMNFFLPLSLTVLGCVLADSVWFFLGRYRGTQVLGLLCRISLEPDSCVRRTQNVFTRYGLRGLLVAKFVPGLNTVAPPLAAMAGISFKSFLLVDGAGSLLYGLFLLGLGWIFGNQIERLITLLSRIGGNVFLVLAGLAALYIGWKFWQRQRLLYELRTARITVGELRRKLAAGEPVMIVDLRPAAELRLDPVIIIGAVHIELDQIDRQTIPRDREVIVYCDCPNEVSSARAALALQRKGFTRIRPLLGGISAWRGQNYPTELSSLYPPNPASLKNL